MLVMLVIRVKKTIHYNKNRLSCTISFTFFLLK